MRLIRSELLKYVSTRTAWGLTAGMFLTGIGFAALFGALFVYGNILDGVELAEVAPPLLLARIIYTSPSSSAISWLWSSASCASGRSTDTTP